MELPATNFGDQKTQYRIKTKNLSYKLQPKGYDLGRFRWWEKPHSKSKYILRNVNCEAKPGELTAIAGPSGAGKTTLLDILAGMITRVSGHVLINDQPMNASHFRRVSGYVTQDEALFPLLTVEEILMFSARLRLRGGLHKAAATRVKELMKELGLEHVAGVRIGSDSQRGISGGEKRRVSIGVDLVHNPNVVMIDEPTSGLDSASALHVVSLLKSMAKNQGKTIVLTIHQPGFRIIEMFDNVVLLANGTLLHHGSMQLLEDRLKFSGYSIPRHVNVLEFSIDVVQSFKIDIEEVDTETSETDEKCLYLRKIITSGNETGTQTVYPNSRGVEIFILSQRFSKNVFRTKQLFSARILQSLVGGILLGTVFMNVNKDPKSFKLQNQLGFFAFSLAFLLSPTKEPLPFFLEERRILMRETSRGAYRVSSYVIATTIVFLPFLLIVALLYSIPVYWLVGLRRDFNSFLYFSLVIWLVVLMLNSLVTCFGALVPNFIMGDAMIEGALGSFFLFAGYFISRDDISRFWSFMYYLSLFRYPFECFILNEYGGEEGKGRCVESLGGFCLLDGNGVLMQQGLIETQKWSNLIMMLIFILGYRVLSFLILWYRSSYKMRS